MKALLYKKFMSAKSSYILTIIVAIAMGAYGVNKGHVFFLPSLCLIFPLILNIITLGIDEESNFQEFVLATPVTRRDYVKSIYFSPLIFSLISGLITWILLYRAQTYEPVLTFLLALTAMSIPLAFTLIMLPFLFRYGAEKGRVIFILIYMIFLAFLNIRIRTEQLTVEKIDNFTILARNDKIIAILIIMLCMYIFSLKISFSVIDNKEF